MFCVLSGLMAHVLGDEWCSRMASTFLTAELGRSKGKLGQGNEVLLYGYSCQLFTLVYYSLIVSPLGGLAVQSTVYNLYV